MQKGNDKIIHYIKCYFHLQLILFLVCKIFDEVEMLVVNFQFVGYVNVHALLQFANLHSRIWRQEILHCSPTILILPSMLCW